MHILLLLKRADIFVFSQFLRFQWESEYKNNSEYVHKYINIIKYCTIQVYILYNILIILYINIKYKIYIESGEHRLLYVKWCSEIFKDISSDWYNDIKS